MGLMDVKPGKRSTEYLQIDRKMKGKNTIFRREVCRKSFTVSPSICFLLSAVMISESPIHSEGWERVCGGKHHFPHTSHHNTVVTEDYSFQF